MKYLIVNLNWQIHFFGFICIWGFKMKLNLMDFKLLFALLVCLCLFVSISNIYAMDIGDGADDSQCEVIDIDNIDDEEAYGSFGWDALDEIDIIPSESINCDTVSIPDLPRDTDNIVFFVNDAAKRFNKDIFKKPHNHKSCEDGTHLTSHHKHHHKLCEDGEQLACHHRHHHVLCEDGTHLTCHHRHYSLENSVFDNHVTDIDTNFSDDFFCYEDFYVNNQDVIFSNYTQLNTRCFMTIPRNLDEKEEEYLLLDLTFNCNSVLDDEICENDFSFALNGGDAITSYVDCESLAVPDTDLNSEKSLTMNYMNSLDSDCVSFDSYALEINNSGVENRIILEDSLEYSIFADSILIIEESAGTVENLCDLSVLTFNNSVSDDDAEITITGTVFTPENCILKDNFETKELTDLFFDELSASPCTLTTSYEINFYNLGNIPFAFIGAALINCSNNHNISIFWRNTTCLI